MLSAPIKLVPSGAKTKVKLDLQMVIKLRDDRTSISNPLIIKEETSYIVNAKPPQRLDLAVFDSNRELYDDFKCRMIPLIKKGQDVTVFAFGGSGSGKSHTIDGPPPHTLVRHVTTATSKESNSLPTDTRSKFAQTSTHRPPICLPTEVDHGFAHRFLEDLGHVFDADTHDFTLTVTRHVYKAKPDVQTHKRQSAAQVKDLWDDAMKTRRKANKATALNAASSRDFLVVQLEGTIDGKRVSAFIVDIPGKETGNQPETLWINTAYEGLRAELKKARTHGLVRSTRECGKKPQHHLMDLFSRSAVFAIACVKQVWTPELASTPEKGEFYRSRATIDLALEFAGIWKSPVSATSGKGMAAVSKMTELQREVSALREENQRLRLELARFKALPPIDDGDIESEGELAREAIAEPIFAPQRDRRDSIGIELPPNSHPNDVLSDFVGTEIFELDRLAFERPLLDESAPSDFLRQALSSPSSSSTASGATTSTHSPSPLSSVPAPWSTGSTASTTSAAFAQQLIHFLSDAIARTNPGRTVDIDELRRRAGRSPITTDMQDMIAEKRAKWIAEDEQEAEGKQALLDTVDGMCRR